MCFLLDVDGVLDFLCHRKRALSVCICALNSGGGGGVQAQGCTINELGRGGHGYVLKYRLVGNPGYIDYYNLSDMWVVM